MRQVSDVAVAEFCMLFRGREEAYGTEEGGCWRNPKWAGSDGTQGITWVEMVTQHLRGNTPIGVYPMIPVGDGNWEVQWGCVDFDVRSDHHATYDYATSEEAHVAARNLQHALALLGITGWIEVTRSYGRHVWVFANGWVPAATMRRALLVACQVANVSSREVNPKAETLDSEDTLGNYVRLPYPGIGPDSTRIVVTQEERAIDLNGWTGAAMAARAPLATLQRVADMWVPPAPPRVKAEVRPYEGGALDSLYRELTPMGKVVFRDGTQYGDRSMALHYLARECRKSGLDGGEAYALVSDADARWGKFHGRADCERRLLAIVGDAYA